ncbi:MAG: DNA-formamidopyrimidine glycosylase family protein [Nonlabens sp.]
MPELPEVYGYQQYINATSLNQKIVGMDCRDKRLLRGSLAVFKKEIIDQSWIKTERIGKYLFVHLSSGKVLVMHFGMTGRPTYFSNIEDRPRFGHIVVAFENGFHFAFENKRKFGWWELTDSVEKYRKANKLSIDARDLTFDEFYKGVKHRKTAIKNVLMNQSVCAGVGNWIADDVLYQAKVHPLEKAFELSESEIKLLYDKLQHVLDIAIRLEAHYVDFPDYFLIHNRKGREHCYHTGDELEKIKIGGRTTYYSPGWQVRK